MTGLVGPGHDSGMLIRLSDCDAPDWVFRNFKVFHAFFAASFVLIAYKFHRDIIIRRGSGHFREYHLDLDFEEKERG